VNSLLPADATEEQVADVQRDLEEPLSHVDGPYANFTQDRGDEVTASIYPPDTLARLRAAKAEIDPGDVFRPMHHISIAS